MENSPKSTARRKSLELFPGHSHETKKYLTAEINTSYRKASTRPISKVFLEDECMEVPGDKRLVFSRAPNVVRQSPIDIQVENTVFDPEIANTPLVLEYPTVMMEPAFLQNTGNTWKVPVSDDRFYLKGGPLKGLYQLDQFHAHWGSTNIVGSEHRVNRYSYAAEIHFVHWNTTKCRLVNDAVSMPDGIAVLGVFLKIGKPHPEFDKLTSMMDRIHYRGQEESLEAVNLSIRELLPKDVTQYWTYDGSLTTVPYDDCVIWIVLKNHIEVSSDQLNAMRSLVCFQEGGEFNNHAHGGRLVENYRPVQEKTNSKVRSSFKPPIEGIF